ncbi:hypothetical protein [Cronobacter dublinensis]|uniref:hypothetical protein n=1 Tax=Cronobacter dublinensis TaxID=413497 RepID=UPI001375CDFA|nr:hypothetical protein [Cronobacter dublinensis]NCH94008.1 hypothetical protein [Cronobacter dublinensis]
MKFNYPERTSKHDKHKLDGLFYCIGNRWLMLPLWAIFTGSGVVISLQTSCWIWISRFGALGIMVGTLLTLSPIFINGIYLSTGVQSPFGSYDEDGNARATSPSSRKSSNNIVLGVILIVISTIINGFGDWILGSFF